MDLFKSNIDKKFSLFVRVIMLGLCVFIPIYAMTIPTEDIKIDIHSMEQLDSGWYNGETGENIDNLLINVGPGELIILSRILPEKLGDRMTVGYYDPGFHAVAYVDQNQIYNGGNMGALKLGNELGLVWRAIELTDDMSGKEFKLILENCMESNLVIDMSQSFLGSVGDIALEMVMTSRASEIMFFVCVFVSVALAFLSVAVWRINRKDYFSQITTLIFLTMCVGDWILADGSILQSNYSNASVRYYTAYISLIMIPLLLNIYYKNTLGEGQIVYEIVQNTYQVAITICLILHVFDLVHISQTLFIIHAFFLAEVFMIGHFGIKRYRRTKDIGDIGPIICFVIVVIFAGIALNYFYFGARGKVSFFIGIGYILFLLVIIGTQINKIIRDYRNQIKEAEYKALASIDSVTRGNSRNVLYDYLTKDEIFEEGNPWFVHMDLLKFASINVSFGWENGNEILKGIYDTNRIYIDEEKEIECCLGNASFGFVLSPNTDIDEFCIKLSNGLSTYLQRRWDGAYLNAKYSAVRIQKNELLESILDHTSIAYTHPLCGYSKESNCYYYNEECQEEIRKRYRLENQIEIGLDNDEFEMRLFPKFDVNTGELVGAEALMRWNSVIEGDVSPAEFIPVAEKSGQIKELDLRIFEKACEYLCDRRNNGYKDIPISINVSKYAIENVEFFYDYKRIIDNTGVPIENLEFEVTEALAYKDLNEMRRLVDKVHSAGARILMDNFGSSYSNLSNLGKLQFDMIKIDKSLLFNGFPEEKESYTLIKGLIEMFHEMGLTVVCEGVESELQYRTLKELKCDYVHGFYFTEPLSVEEFDKKYQTK